MISHAIRLVAVAVSLAISPAFAAGTQPFCPWAVAAKHAPETIIDIDKVWAGARVDFAAVGSGTHYKVGYYNQERWLTIADVNAVSREIKRQQLPTRFAGWDSHNAIALAVDRAGLLHVAANMHAAKLNYFRETGPNQPLASAPMTGRDEERVTYPQFLNTSDGNLLFIYRSGGSGDGVWKVNRWDGSTWTSVTNRPFFGDRGFGRKVSAYPSRFAISSDGYIHLAIVWRLTPDAATNVRISYAKTRDFLHWFDSRGTLLSLPLSPETTETVLHTGANAGLLNNAKVSLDPSGRPVIAFTRQDSQGHNTVELMVGNNGQWTPALVATSDHSNPVAGTGSLPNTVALTEVDFSRADRPAIYYHFPGSAAVHEVLAPDTLSPVCEEKLAGDSTKPFVDRPIQTMSPQTLAVDTQSSLVWAAQPANHDQPPPCTASAPLACNPPPSMLRLLVTSDQSAKAR